ncbi:hypothetical protein ACFPGO_01085 [Arcanobacterium canis]|uniref:Uncharacterized protein n=1 Tax=Arcanobacterium canis TaxID=999183 RepID=A0ABY8G238_9ACTO|nr:hypothetical protein [Arcanobacterium canis]WFM82724.1 hypothetical protein P7079_04770 [Arcanobacterium canis]
MNEEWNADAEWRKAQAELALGGSSVPHEPSSDARAAAERGPRDWSPPDEEELTAFDREILEQPHQTFPVSVVIMFILACAGFIVAFLGLFGVLSSSLAGIGGAIGFSALVVAIWLSLPTKRDFDDDGARV